MGVGGVTGTGFCGFLVGSFLGAGVFLVIGSFLVAGSFLVSGSFEGVFLSLSPP